MMSSSAEAEVAADFRDALQDLRLNSRPEISNLTVVAKENTEYAEAISKVLEEHIKKTRPEWKLPALYVLDSIVKNVGTPYTLYLSRNLSKTFLDAYLLVDTNTRKSMEALMKTWKQPVPESLDSRPVFRPEVTRDIENTLIKIRTALLQHQQQSRPQQQPLPGQAQQQRQQQQWRNTPTPPQAGWQPPQPGAQQLHQSLAQPPNVPSPLRQLSTPYNAMTMSATPVPQQIGHSQPTPDLEQVKRDVNQLIVSISIELTTTPTAENKSLLGNLVSLQNILQAPQGVSPSNLAAINQEVSRIRGSSRSVPIHQPTPPPVQASLPAAPADQWSQIAALLQQAGPSQAVQAAKPPELPPALSVTPLPTQPRTPVPLPSNDQITALLAALGPPLPQSINTPPPRSHHVAAVTQPAPSNVPSTYTPVPPASQAPASFDLFASLRSAGLLSATPTMNTEGRVKSPVQSVIPPSLAALAAPLLKLETASLKVPRAHMITRLYSERPDQCRQCGRRFLATDDGKKKKAQHLDWHFKNATRIADAANNIVNRLPYLNELAWIRYREPDPLNPDKAKLSHQSPSKSRAMRDVVPVPKDGGELNTVCPICQDQFTKAWSEEMQAWVWTDAIKAGGKVWHKSCFDEVKGAGAGAGSSNNLATSMSGYMRGGTPNRSTPTPESVLGKRKLENAT